MATRFARARLRPDRVNALGVAELRHCGPSALLARLRERLEPRGLTAGFDDRIALVDGLIHHQDIRRPLARPREVPAARLLPALAFARFAPPIGALQRARGPRLVATDLGWSAGRGLELGGPAEPLLMAIAGRRAALDNLTGPGRAVLAARP